MLRVVLFLASATTVLSERGEHRIHNIILNPEKYSRCQTTRIQQVVASPGYEPVTIDNNVCVGWCYSYSIPSTQPAEPGELIGPYCDSCQPVETKCYHVTLRADGKTPDAAPTFQKRVQIIKRCLCKPCEHTHRQDCEVPGQPTLELPHDLFSNHTQEPAEEVPELLHFPAPSDAANASAAPAAKQELLRGVEGPEGELSDEDLLDLVNFVNVHEAEDPELDRGRLKDALAAFRRRQPPPGRLVRGPHGSLVLAPDLEVERKLDIDSDGLQPNHDGVVIEYESHGKGAAVEAD